MQHRLFYKFLPIYFCSAHSDSFVDKFLLILNLQSSMQPLKQSSRNRWREFQTLTHNPLNRSLAMYQVLPSKGSMLKQEWSFTVIPTWLQSFRVYTKLLILEFVTWLLTWLWKLVRTCPDSANTAELKIVLKCENWNAEIAKTDFWLEHEGFYILYWTGPNRWVKKTPMCYSCFCRKWDRKLKL